MNGKVNKSACVCIGVIYDFKNSDRSKYFCSFHRFMQTDHCLLFFVNGRFDFASQSLFLCMPLLLSYIHTFGYEECLPPHNFDYLSLLFQVCQVPSRRTATKGFLSWFLFENGEASKRASSQCGSVPLSSTVSVLFDRKFIRDYTVSICYIILPV